MAKPDLSCIHLDLRCRRCGRQASGRYEELVREDFFLTDPLAHHEALCPRCAQDEPGLQAGRDFAPGSWYLH